MFSFLLVMIQIFVCSGSHNTYFSMWPALLKSWSHLLYTEYILNEIYIRTYNFIFCILCLENVETSKCFVKSHVVLKRWIGQIFLVTLRNKCVLFSFSLGKLVPRIFVFSVMLDQLKVEFTLLRNHGYLMTFLLEILQWLYLKI